MEQKLKLLPHQGKFIKTFLTDDQIWALALVSGFGGGKSHTLATSAVLLLLRFPGINIGVYSVTFDLIKLVNIVQVISILDQLNIKFSINKADYIITVPSYGKIIFRSLDNPARIIGYETAFSLIDELDTLDQHKAEFAWNMVIARNRQRLPADYNIRNKIGVFTTPEGYKFVYKRWQKNQKPGYALIRARTEDNIHLPPEYISNLKDSYPDNLIDAYLNGHFVNLTGNVVYYAFDRNKNHLSVDEFEYLSESDNVVNI